MRTSHVIVLVLIAVATAAFIRADTTASETSNETPAMTIAMTSVYVDDPIRAFEFYTEVLGFQELQFMPEAHLAVVISPEQPNGAALLLEPNQHPIATRYQKEVYEAGFPVIVFGTTDIQAEYTRLVDRGVVFRGEPQETPYGTHADFEDTFGNLIRLIQQPESAQ